MNRLINRIGILLFCSFMLVACKPQVASTDVLDIYPSIYPDYVDVTIPATIAPLNFNVIANCQYLLVKILGSRIGKIEFDSKGNLIDIPEMEWRKLLYENKGGSLSVALSVIDENKREIVYKPFSIHISIYPIDYGIVYRYIAPGYTVYSRMGIYERKLSSYEQNTIFENTQISRSCVNCHSFNQGNPASFSMHIRGENGGTVLRTENGLEILDTKNENTLSAGVYPYWHPSGKYIAYSTNATEQLFHPVSDKRVEVYDKASDIYVYSIETNKLLSSPLLRTESFETFPAFSPDGRTLFFCSAERKNMPFEYKKLKYSLCSINFNPNDGSFGNKIDTLFSAYLSNKSVAFPRPSFDGKYLMFTLSDYGCFPVWHKEADLWLLDLYNKSVRELIEVNSKDSESFHCWSSNSRWFLFTSRRGGGLYTCVYISAIDEKGHVSKPFMLPQKNPLEYYDRLLYSYNVPEFITGPINLNSNEMEEKVLSNRKKKVRF